MISRTLSQHHTVNGSCTAWSSKGIVLRCQPLTVSAVIPTPLQHDDSKASTGIPPPPPPSVAHPLYHTCRHEPGRVPPLKISFDRGPGIQVESPPTHLEMGYWVWAQYPYTNFLSPQKLRRFCPVPVVYMRPVRPE